MPDSTTLAPLSVVAVVQFNDEEALVLNRPLQLTYERVGNDYIGSDGPFRAALVYSHGSGRFVAFAGRELTIAMKDGTTQKLKDHWWSGSIKGYRDITRSDVESLKRCYVFSSALCDPESFAALRSSYQGCVYPYRDYEKLIKYDDLWKRLFHEEGRCKALIQAIKAKDAELRALDPGQKLRQMERDARAAVQAAIDKAAARHLAAMASTWAAP
ncbi:hypothetical protein KDK82_1768 [Delftia sp. K82]|uniref:hypothetical protein n=1 Tax=Delftia sp. K82 TaxID=1472718 RepID=UPI000B48A8A9|nr:hypothetical protein [Delftia sp. K82]OWG18289.1 hypothetical protein KDK82_1768 [Delftia sp. K82]